MHIRFAFLLAPLLTAPSQAQTLALDDPTQGQLAAWELTAAPPGHVAFLIVSFAGIGGPGGFCIEPTTCLDLANPVHLLATRVVAGDGSASWTLPVPTSVPSVPLYSQVLTGGLGTGGPEFATSNAIANTIQPISALDDDFEGSALDPAWQVLHPDRVTIDVSGGALHLTPTVTAPLIWFNDDEAGYVYKEVTGDFEMSALVRTHAAGDPNAPPATGFRLGGILVRDPNATAPGTHDWAHVALGSGATTTSGIERKNTVSSVSDWQLFPLGLPVPEQELRVRREGQTVTLFHRDPGAADWTELASYAKPGFPARVQIGLMVYSHGAPPAVTTRVEWASFAP